MSITPTATLGQFLSTPSARRATLQKQGYKRRMVISIHALREEGDDGAIQRGNSSTDFYPRPPRGGRPGRFDYIPQNAEFLSTPSARRATLSSSVSLCRASNFYPRPPRGGRLLMLILLWITCYFYPRPPRGGRHTPSSSRLSGSIFLSTPSARRATCRSDRSRVDAGNFYPRPPRGGRHDEVQKMHDMILFLSTPSARRATATLLRIAKAQNISIHALREEGDFSLSPPSVPHFDFYPRPPRGGRRPAVPATRSASSYFYPRPPRGGRHNSLVTKYGFAIFLSTPSARRAT